MIQKTWDVHEIPKLSDCYRREAQKRLTSHAVVLPFSQNPQSSYITKSSFIIHRFRFSSNY